MKPSQARIVRVTALTACMSMSLMLCADVPERPVLRPAPGPQPVLVPVPQPLAPADGAVLTNYPRQVTLSWRPLPGFTFQAEVDCLDCRQAGKWDSEIAPLALLEAGRAASVTTTCPGDNRYRWRVRARRGLHAGAWSPWRRFIFRTAPATAKPNVCVPCCLTVGRKTTPWGDDRHLTLDGGDVAGVSGGQAVYDIAYVIKNCKGGPASGFRNRIYYNGQLVSEQSNLSLAASGSPGDQQTVRTQAYLPRVPGILKMVVDAVNDIDEEWEGDNEVWVHVSFPPIRR